MSPIGTNTVTFPNFHEGVPGRDRRRAWRGRAHQPERREDDRADEQYLARCLHKTRLPGTGSGQSECATDRDDECRPPTEVHSKERGTVTVGSFPGSRVRRAKYLRLRGACRTSPQHPPIRSRSGCAVVPRARGVEERVIDVGERHDLVPQAGGAQRRPRRRTTGVDPRVELRIDPEHGCLRAREVPVLGKRAVEGNSGRQARLPRRQQEPHHPTAETEAGGSNLLPRKPAAKLVTPAFMSATNRDGGAAPSAAMASNSSANEPVPPFLR